MVLRKKRMLETKKGSTSHTLWGTRFGRGYRPVVKADYGMREYAQFVGYKLVTCLSAARKM
jgi:hypothetical protein